MENGFSSPRSDAFPAGLRVLVVDDDPTWLRILEKMLKKCTYEGKSCLTIWIHSCHFGCLFLCSLFQVMDYWFLDYFCVNALWVCFQFLGKKKKKELYLFFVFVALACVLFSIYVAICLYWIRWVFKLWKWLKVMFVCESLPCSSLKYCF